MLTNTHSLPYKRTYKFGAFGKKATKDTEVVFFQHYHFPFLVKLVKSYCDCDDMHVLVGSLCPGWQMGQVECKVKVNGLPMNTSVGVLYRKRTKALTSSLGNARIPGAP